MIQTVEQIIDSIRALPPAERDRFREFEELERRSNSSENGTNGTEVNDDSFKKSLQWIQEHKEEYDGQWVCLDGDQLIAHGVDARLVYDLAKSKGIEIPFIERVKAKILPWGGW